MMLIDYMATGDFFPRLLVSLNVFNSALMNQAVFQFKRYEDASLEYAGVNKHKEDTYVGGYDTAITKDEFVNMEKS